MAGRGYQNGNVGRKGSGISARSFSNLGRSKNPDCHNLQSLLPKRTFQVDILPGHAEKLPKVSQPVPGKSNASKSQMGKRFLF
jgi:hypothetical protein